MGEGRGGGGGCGVGEAGVEGGGLVPGVGEELERVSAVAGGGGADCGSGAVGRRLRAVLAWPCDEERREGIVRQNMAHDCERLR
jgi:hypothetical protein